MTKRTLALVAFAALAGSAAAQGQGGTRGFMRMMSQGPMAQAMLLDRDDVQQELKITDDQKGKLDALRSSARDRMRAAFAGGGFQPGGDMSQLQEKIAPIMEDMAKEAVGALDDVQKKRLRELSIQASGTTAVLQKDVAKDLEITASQKTKIEDLQRMQSEANEGIWEQVRNGDLDREDAMSNMEKNAKTLDAEILKVLKPDQRTKLKTLSGVKFEFKDPKPGTPGSFRRPG